MDNYIYDITSKDYHKFLLGLYKNEMSSYYREETKIIKSIGESIESGKYNTAVLFNNNNQCLLLKLRGVIYNLSALDIVYYNGRDNSTNKDFNSCTRDLILSVMLLTDVFRGYGPSYTVSKGLDMFRFITDVYDNISTNFEPGYLLNRGISDESVLYIENWIRCKSLLLSVINRYPKNQFIKLQEEIKSKRLSSSEEDLVLLEALEAILSNSSFDNLKYSKVDIDKYGKDLKEFIYYNKITVK